MNKLILLIGVPGSGKTTLAKNFVQKGFARLCADDIRLELYGDAAKQGDAKAVFKIFFERLEILLKKENDIIIDNTNIKFEHRKQIIDCAQKAKYGDIQLWVLDIPLSVCLERNQKRERKVPEDVITNLYNTLKRHGKPRNTEGQIVIIDTEQIDKLLSG